MTRPALEDPRRLHYLDAMGLSTWTARYRLPNAAPTPASEWQQPQVAAASAQAPAQRLHALLDEPISAKPAAPESKPDQALPASLRAFRSTPSPDKKTPVQPVQESPAEADKAAVKHEPLRFTLQLGALEGRWLVVMAEDNPPSSVSMRFLSQLLFAAGINATLSVLQTFRWPMMDELPVEEPLEEAQEGLAAFLAGRKRDGWNIERLLVFGESPALKQVLGLGRNQGQEQQKSDCPLLELPAWQGLSLETLMQSSDAKRALWPTLREWGRQWQAAMTSKHDIQDDS